jgi:hypothetical protein
MKTKIPDKLITEICEGNSTLFAGAGLSASSKLPDWPVMMHGLIKWAEENNRDLKKDKKELERLIKQNEFLLVAEKLKECLGNDLFKQFMYTTFRDDTKKPSRIHAILPDISFAAVLTTNYDVLLETAYTIARGMKPHTYTHTDVAQIIDLNDRKEFYILKMHGDIDNFDTVVVTQNDYRKLMFDNKAYREFLKVIFMTKTVFFVGFSLNDPDLVFLLDELETTFKDNGRQTNHYALMNARETGSIQRSNWKDNYGIQIIPYEATEGHPEVYDILSGISARVSLKIASSTFEWIKPGIHGSNFIVEGPSMRAHQLFLEMIRDFLRKDTRKYSPIIVQVNMEQTPEHEFLQKIGQEFSERIAAKYPLVKTTEHKKNAIRNVSDLEKLITDLTSELQKTSQKQISVVLLLTNGDAMNKFGFEVKENLRYLLEASGLGLTAIITAQNLETGASPEWNVSPWNRPYLRKKLE